MKKINFNENWLYKGKKIALPHDAMLEDGRDKDSNGGSANAFFVGGIYEYTKEFEVDSSYKDKHVLLEFEGVYRNAKVYLNDKLVGGTPYGYIPFFCNLDDAIKCGEKNVIKVVADNKDLPNSRWYTGGGIYRNVFMHVGPKDSIEPESVKIDTVSIDPAIIHVSSLKEIIFTVDDETKEGTDFDLTIKNAKLWSESNPYLYTAKVKRAEDSLDIKFGIRKIEKRSDGIYLNNERILLRGGCVHHDNGILGSASYDDAEYRKVKILKESGFNAIRSAHNPCSRAMLDACDSLGVYLMDESWDMWYNHKSKYDYASLWEDNYLNDLKAMVNRDYNHPSVILYSIGNEVSEPAQEKGINKTKEMVEYLHSLDKNRLVTGGFNLMIISRSKAGKGIYDDENGGQTNDTSNKMQGMNSTMFNMIVSMIGTGMNNAANSKSVDLITSPSLNSLDIAGYNYASGRYKNENKLHKNRIIIGSETFPSDIAKNWNMIKKYPWVVGDFMWTAWDYLGEAGIGSWAYTDDAKSFSKPYPWLLADAGAIDIIGTKGAELALAQAAWNLDKAPWVGVTPLNHGKAKVIKASWRGTNAIDSWSWASCEGAKGTVEVYSSQAKIEVLINGKSLGKKKLVNCKATFKIKYEPGSLAAIAYDELNNEVSRTELKTAGSNTKLTLKEEIYNDLKFISVLVTDEDGIIESNRDRLVKVKVENGELLAFGSANPRTEESFLKGEYTTYYGRALAIVKGKNAKLIVE